MNTDRFLTRVWDRQEKKMIYIGDEVSPLSGEYIGCDNRVIRTKRQMVGSDSHLSWEYFWYYIGDRFVPMQCTGNRGKNEKPFYGEDIIKTPDGRIGKIHYHDELGYFMVKFKGDMFTCPAKSFLAKCELLGNRWENENLLEVKA